MGNGNGSALLAPWQPPTDGRGQPFSLSELKPSAKPFPAAAKRRTRRKWMSWPPNQTA